MGYPPHTCSQRQPLMDVIPTRRNFALRTAWLAGLPLLNEPRQTSLLLQLLAHVPATDRSTTLLLTKVALSGWLHAPPR